LGGESKALLGVVLWPSNRPLRSGYLSAQITLGFVLPMGMIVSVNKQEKRADSMQQQKLLVSYSTFGGL
jgi:hypothetical protein